MLIDPMAALRCIKSINGHVLFMPSSYVRDETTFPAFGQSPWEVRSLNMVTYYLLVFWTFTGLSTLLSATEIIDAQEQVCGRDLAPEGLKSDVVPTLEVDQIVVNYLMRCPIGTDSVGNKSRTMCKGVRLVRRFEFNFRLSALQVVMLHFLSLGPDGHVMTDGEGREIVHLVEVYEAGPALKFWQAALVALGLALVVSAAV